MERTASGLLRNPDFLKLWFGQSISEFGSRISRDALPIIAVSVLNATPAQMGWLSAATSLPILLFGLLAGVWVDRLRRRPLMILADVTRLALLLLVPLAYLGGWLSLPIILVVSSAMSLLGLLFESAYRALLPAIVGRDSLLQANSRLSTTDSLAEIGGPALTGVLVQVFSAPLAMLVDAASYVASIISLASMRAVEPPAAPHARDSHVWRELAEGFAVLRHDPILKALAAVMVLRAFFGAGIGALYDLLILRDIGLTPAVLGVLVATGGVGALLGTVAALRLPRHLGAGQILIGALLVNSVVAFCIPLAASVPAWTFILLMIGQVVGDGAMMVFFIHRTTIQQVRIPDRLLGRVNASLGVLAEGIGPIGAVFAGLLAHDIGVAAMLWIIALGLLATAVYALLSPLRRVHG